MFGFDIMGTSVNNSVYIEFHLFFDVQLMMYRVNDLSPVEPFFQDSYSSSAFTDPEIIDSLSPLLKYSAELASKHLPSKADYSILSFLEHYDTVSFESLLRNASHEEEKFIYWLE